MPLLGVELEPVLVSFGRFYDIFVIFFNYATFLVVRHILPSFLGVRLFAIFFGATFLSSLILYGDFCHLFEATTFLPSFSARGFKTALLTKFVSKTACENQDHI